MDNNPIQLRISAKKLYERIFYDVKLENFFDFAGFKLSNGAVSVDARAAGLANFCKSPRYTTRRWITGESQPNGTNSFLIYGAVLAGCYDGDQVQMLYDFLEWHDRTLLKEYFILPLETKV